jgi:hypothetical protein
MTKTLFGNMKGPPGEIMPRRSKRVYSPSSAGFDPETIRLAIEASLRSAGADGAGPPYTSAQALLELPAVSVHPEDFPPARSTATRSTKGKNLKVSKNTPSQSTKGKKWEVGKMKRTQVVTPDGKTQSSLAKLRSRFGYDTGVQSEHGSETSEVANTTEARMLNAKTGGSGNAKTSGKASKNKKIKMFASYKSRKGALQNADKRSVLEQLEEGSDSIPDSMFPHWVQESYDTDEEGLIGG